MSFKFREEHLQILIIILLILLILPFFILSFFNHPCPEDMSWTENAHRNGFIRSQLSLLTTEGGRFFTYALISLNPLILHSITGYKIIVLLMMLLMLFSIHFFFREIFNDNLSFTETALASISVFFLYLYGMPSVGEGFYYLTGVALYNLSLILLMMFFAFLLRRTKTLPGNKLYFNAVICFILFAAILGTCELAIALMSYSILILFFYEMIKHKRKDKLLTAFIVLIIAAGILLMLSPGNQHRSDKYILKHDLVNSVYSSFSFTLSTIYFLLFKTPISGITIILLPVFFSMFKKSNESSKKVPAFLSLNPIACLILSFVILISLNFIIFFGLNITPYTRIQNFVYFIFLILWIWNLIILCSYLSGKFSFNYKRYAVMFYITGFIIVSLYLSLRSNNIKTAYSELIRGTASEYDDSMNERYRTIYECKDDSCQVDSIVTLTKTLSEVQLTSDPNNNFNRWYSRFFHKKNIYCR